MKLRPYQADTFELVIDKIRQKVRRMLVVAATGAGKTVLFAAFAERGIRRGSRGVILAPRQEIVQQSYRKLIDAGLEPAQVGIQLGGVKGQRDTRAVDPWDAHARLRPKAPVQLGTMPSFNIRKWIHNNPAPDWLVIDEAHLAVSATYRSFIDEAMRLNPNLVVIGLTATPYRIDGLSFDDIFDDLIVMARPGDLATWINEETGRPYLMRPDVWGVPKEKTANTDNVRVRKQKGLEADYDKEELEEASMRSDLVGSIVEEWKKRAYGHRTVAFAVGVKHSKFIVENFLKEGIPAEHLDGSVPSHERRAILKRLETGKTLIVSNCDVLTEGWDCLDSKTEVLTAAGWKGMGQIQIGDMVESLNTKSGHIELVPALAVGSRPTRPGERMVSLRSQRFDIRTTEGHRFYIKPRLRKGPVWEIITAGELSSYPREFKIPVSGRSRRYRDGIPLSDDEIRFIAWFMTDGGFCGSAVCISQVKDYHHEIRALLKRLRLDFKERKRTQSTTFGDSTSFEFRIPKGTAGGKRARNGWHERFWLYLDKNVSRHMHQMTRRQFMVYWMEALKGDGEQLDKSGWLWCDRQSQIDAYSQMAATRGLSSVVQSRVTEKGKTVFRISLKDREEIGYANKDPRSARIGTEEATPGEMVWCVTNENGTLVTRRGGRTAILGNCPIVSCAILARKTKSLRIGIQEIGRVLRDHPDKPTPVILDHAGFCLKYGGPMRYREYSLQASSPSGEDVGRLCTVCASVLDQEELILVVKNNFGEWEETDDDSMGDDDDSMGLRVVGWMCPKCRIKVWKKRRPAPKAERPGETKGELELYAEETHPARPISKALQEYNTRLENFEAENDARLRRGDRPHLPGELRFKWMSDHQGKNPPKGHKRPKLTDEQQAMIDLHEAMEEKR